MANYFGASYQPTSQYGGAPPLPPRKRPSRLNFAAICLCLFVPWLLFCLMYAVMSFSLHYNDKLTCYLCVFIGFLIVVGVCKLAFDSTQKTDASADPSWFVFLAVASLIAWVAGVALGDMNFFYNMEPFYDVSNLNSYPSVDPSSTPGQQLMDAGRMTFVSGSRLDVKKAMGFRNLEVYCVAPIVKGNATTSQGAVASYDFWAVGLNCCSGAQGNFACGEFNNPHASSGLRVMRKDQSTFYRLAVKQAEAAYGIKAKHPVFLYWMQDPLLEIAAYMDEGMKFYIFGVFTFFAFLLFLILVAVVIFSKMA